MKRFIAAAAVSLATLTALPAQAGWFSDDADVASRNLSKAADNFEVMRRIVSKLSAALEVTCMTDDDFKKHFLGLNDTTTYFVEQLQPSRVSRSHYRVTFKPQAIIPDIDFRWDQDDLTTNHSEANQ